MVGLSASLSPVTPKPAADLIQMTDYLPSALPNYPSFSFINLPGRQLPRSRITMINPNLRDCW